MKRILFLGVNLSLFLILFFSNAPAQSWVWANQYGGGSGTSEGVKIDLDTQGNLYVVGHFQGAITFGSTTLVSAGSQDIFLAQFDINGVPQWARRAGGGSADYVSGMALDPWGNIYITGRFSNTADFGSNVLVSAGTANGFLARFDTNGTVDWAQNVISSANNAGCADVDVNPAGDVCIAGWFTGNATVGGTIPLTSIHAGEIFVSQLDTGGVPNWALRDGGNALPTAIAASNTNIFVGGRFNDSTLLAGDTLRTNSFYDSDAFLSVYNINQSPGGSASFGTYGNQSIEDLYIQGNYGLIACGNFSDHIFSESCYCGLGWSTPSSYYYFNGVFRGSHGFGTNSNAYGIWINGNDVLSVGNMNVAGNVEGAIAHTKALGNVQSPDLITGVGTATGRSVVGTANGFAYITGDFTNSAAFGPINLPGPGNANRTLFVAKIDYFNFLPIEFESFNGRYVSGEVDLQWHIGTTDGGGRFEIERSSDGSLFSTIGTVEGTTADAYFFTDATPLSGSAFYRIQAWDQNGESSLSPTIEISPDPVGNFEWDFFPNPVSDQLNVTFESPQSGAVGIMISDLQGRLLQDEQLTVPEGISTYRINSTAWEAGVYLMEINRDGQTATKRLMKVNP